ncbi:MAG: hypothetical protein ABIL09_03965 [Gemmatimonadota bacterium]
MAIEPVGYMVVYEFRSPFDGRWRKHRVTKSDLVETKQFVRQGRTTDGYRNMSDPMPLYSAEALAQARREAWEKAAARCDEVVATMRREGTSENYSGTAWPLSLADEFREAAARAAMEAMGFQQVTKEQTDANRTDD